MRGPRYSLGSFAIALVLATLLPSCGSSSQATGKPPGSPGFGVSGLVGKEAPDFSLLDQFHHPRRLSDYRGRVVMLTFVSSRCAAICPLTAQLLTRTQVLLGTQARDTQLVAVNANVIFNSVHDVLAWSKQHRMTHRWVFLTGSVDELMSVYGSYGVTPGSAHTVVVFLIDPQGQVRSLVPIASKNGIDAETRVLARYVSRIETD